MKTKLVCEYRYGLWVRWKNTISAPKIEDIILKFRFLKIRFPPSKARIFSGLFLLTLCSESKTYFVFIVPIFIFLVYGLISSENPKKYDNNNFLTENHRIRSQNWYDFPLILVSIAPIHTRARARIHFCAKSVLRKVNSQGRAGKAGSRAELS